ncbi:MAG TPA: hypothetical protein PLU54_01660 [Deltaproteobacteria bacterium]|nr:hypothetical protein [Deltaproteobacteria bacterium]
MRKILMFLMALALAFTFAVPAFALENIFGGYWRTRAYIQQDFTGDDSGDLDLTQTTTRTRLYYTAKFNENFQFVNKFEMDAVFGGQDRKFDIDGDGSKEVIGSSYGNIGADGVSVEVKNSYADMTFDKTNVKLGVQGTTICRGFIFDDDFAGTVVTYKASDTLSIPLMWIKANEGGQGEDANDYDVDYYAVYPTVNLGKATVKPLLMWTTSSDASSFAGDSTIDKWNVYYLGADVDANVGPASVWFTGIYEFGTIKGAGTADDTDVGAYLLGLGASTDVDKVSVHGQIFYASGQDPDEEDITAFFVPAGQSYYWSEIMGYGIFDDMDVSNNSPADQISDIMALNLGAAFKATDKLTLNADLWYAQLAEDDANGNTDLGMEIDLGLSYSVLDNVTLDVVAAYLVAGDSTTEEVSNDENPMEMGVQLSFSF